MAGDSEAVLTRVLVDERIQRAIAELAYRATGVADQVMVVATMRELVAHASVIEGKPADNLRFLKQLDRPEDRRPSHVRDRST